MQGSRRRTPVLGDSVDNRFKEPQGAPPGIFDVNTGDLGRLGSLRDHGATHERHVMNKSGFAGSVRKQGSKGVVGVLSEGG